MIRGTASQAIAVAMHLGESAQRTTRWPARISQPGPPRALNNAFIAAASASKAIVDGDCTKRAVAELSRD